MSIPSISWNRILPRPSPLYHDQLEDRFGRRSSSLLQHHLVSIGEPENLTGSYKDRRGAIQDIPERERSRLNPLYGPFAGSEKTHAISAFPQKFSTSQRVAPLMAEESSPRDESSSSNSISAAEPTNQFCLCQPDPKIPRPRNGKFFFYCFVLQKAFALRAFVQHVCQIPINDIHSFHPLPSTSPSWRRSSASRTCKS